ncbi:hypothetical protein APHAL10511_000281 [Amanita phalloides]|nr:hypothetical protein APHAL10511_000281 [Amanita phalloides]
MARGIRASPSTVPLPKVSFQKTDEDYSLALFGVHNLQARSYGFNDFAEFKRPNHYIQYIEPIETDLARQVEYDMDEQDQEWLDAVNSERRKEQIDTVSCETFEIIMDRLEKEWFDLTKNIPKTDFAMPSEDSTCAVCDDSEGENSNAIVFCDGCNLAVHQDCYGVPYIPEGQWLCRKCTVSPEIPVFCILCPNEGGAFKQTVTGDWVHLLCAIWVPETRVANEVFMEPITGIDKISKQRWKLKCSLCEIKEGACIQCAKASCFTAFHTTCARKEKLLMPMKSAQGSEPVTLACYCEKHLPKEQQDSRVVALERERIVEEEEKNITMLSKSARAYAKTYKPGPPVVPSLIIKRILNYIAKVQLRKRQEFVQTMARYWSLKREARRGAPLLKRLHLEPWTANGGSTQSDEDKEIKLELLLRLREDMEKVHEMTILTRRRELRKQAQATIIRDTLLSVFAPFEYLVRDAFNRIVMIDRNDYFRNPVSKTEVPDYFDIVKKPMNWSMIDEKIKNHSYFDSQNFKDDITLVIDNAILYNQPNTAYHKAAVRIRSAMQSVFEELDRSLAEAKVGSNTRNSQLPSGDYNEHQQGSAVVTERISVGDLEPPLEFLELLTSLEAIQAGSELVLDKNPLDSLFSFELPTFKPPPPEPSPKPVRPKRDRKADLERKRKEREAEAATRALMGHAPYGRTRRSWAAATATASVTTEDTATTTEVSAEAGTTAEAEAWTGPQEEGEVVEEEMEEIVPDSEPEIGPSEEEGWEVEGEAERKYAQEPPPIPEAEHVPEPELLLETEPMRKTEPLPVPEAIPEFEKEVQQPEAPELWEAPESKELPETRENEIMIAGSTSVPILADAIPTKEEVPTPSVTSPEEAPAATPEVQETPAIQETQADAPVVAPVKRPGRRRGPSSLPGPSSVPPLVTDVDNRGSFRYFDKGWILPPEQKRGGRRPVERQPLPPKKRAKTGDYVTSRLSIVSTTASENQTLDQVSPLVGTAAPSMPIIPFDSPVSNLEAMDVDTSALRTTISEEPTLSPSEVVQRESSESIREMSVHISSVRMEVSPVPVPVSASVPVPALVASPVVEVPATPVSPVSPDVFNIQGIQPKRVVQGPDGQVIVEVLDSPLVRKQMTKLKRAEKKRQMEQQRLEELTRTHTQGVQAEAGTQGLPLVKARTRDTVSISAPVAGPSRVAHSTENLEAESELSSLSDIGSEVVETREKESYVSAPRASRGRGRPPLGRRVSITNVGIPDDLGSIKAGQILEGGTLVWAKARTYPWWPAVVYESDDPRIPLHVKAEGEVQKKKGLSIFMVQFFDKGRSWQFLSQDKLRMLGEHKELDNELLSSRSIRQKWKSPTSRAECKAAYEEAMAEMETLSDIARAEVTTTTPALVKDGPQEQVLADADLPMVNKTEDVEAQEQERACTPQSDKMQVDDDF